MRTCLAKDLYICLIMSCKFLRLVFVRNYVPWMVQLFEGPVVGFVSQNYTTQCLSIFHNVRPQINDRQLTCVCNKRPPGASKQHKSVSRVVLWHEAEPEVLHPELTRLKRSSGPTEVTPVGGSAKEELARTSTAATANMIAKLSSSLWYTVFLSCTLLQ